MKEFPRIGSILLKAATIIAILVGTVFSFVNMVYKGEAFCYYTNQCNMLLLLLMASLLVFDLFGGIRKERYYYMIKFSLTMCSLLSPLVYTGLFSSAEQMTLGGGWYNLITHALVPALALTDYLLCDRRGLTPWYTPLLCGLGPLAHLAFIALRNLSGEGYHIQDSPVIVPAPYGFLRGEPSSIVLTCLVLLAGFIAACFLLRLLDVARAKLSLRNQKESQ